MIEGRRVLLKSGVIVCHGRVTGIAGFGKEAEISQFKSPGQFGALGVC